LSKFGTDQKAMFKNETILKHNNNELKLRKGVTIVLRKLKYAFGCNEARYLSRNDKKNYFKYLILFIKLKQDIIYNSN
jgi:hypothetical protein